MAQDNPDRTRRRGSITRVGATVEHQSRGLNWQSRPTDALSAESDVCNQHIFVNNAGAFVVVWISIANIRSLWKVFSALQQVLGNTMLYVFAIVDVGFYIGLC